MLNCCLAKVVLQDVSKYRMVIHRVLCNSKYKVFVEFSDFRKATDIKRTVLIGT